MINFTRAFDSAWERMLIILFRPFDAGKWFIIGFNAFLALLAEGSASFNGPVSFKNHEQSNFYLSLPSFLHDVKQWVLSLDSLTTSVQLALYVVLGLFFLVLWLVLTWVGCRGQFLFIDNIVRNRAAFAVPWSRYAAQGNAWFLFYLGVTLLTVTLVLFSLGLFIGLDWSWISSERNPQGNETTVLVMLLLVLGGVWIIYGSLVFIVRSFAVPLMFKQTFGLWSALGAVVHLLVTRPVSIVLYVLASFVLAVAAALVCILIACITCCCLVWPALVPFAGSLAVTMVLTQLILPVLVYCRCFQIDCLAQFGSQYDAWIVDVPPSAPPTTLPPRLG